MENEFFLTVANYSLPENTEKYIEAMSNIPDTASHYDYIKWLRYGFERRLGRERIERFIYPTGKTKVYSPFTNEDFKSFERNREFFISVLNQILSGTNFFEVTDLLKISGYANSLQSRELFGIETTAAGTILRKTMHHPKMDDVADELEEVFACACYGLVSFLADSKQGGRDRIKKCPICEKFFLAKDTKRKICYQSKCKKEYHRKDMQLRRVEDPLRYC